jgi:hypothetical protein
VETTSITKTDEVIKTLKKIGKKIDLLEANSIENISKLIDDKFQKNFLKVGSIGMQKLIDEIDFETLEIQLNNEIENVNKNKKEIQKLILDENVKNLSETDKKTLSKLEKMSVDGGLFDQYALAISKEERFSFYNLLSNMLLTNSISSIQSKLSHLAITPIP